MTPTPPEQIDPTSASVDQLKIGCLAERDKFLRDKDPISPCCAQLFRRALDGDKESWSALHDILRPGALRLIERKISVLYPHLEGIILPETVFNDAFTLLWRRWPTVYAASVPDEKKGPILDEKNNLNRVMGLWRYYVNSCFGDTKRKEDRQRLPFVPPNFLDSGGIDKQVELQHLIEQIHLRFETYIERERTSGREADKEKRQERIVLEEYFYYREKPANIVKRYPEDFKNTGEVDNVKERLAHFMRIDPLLQDYKRQLQKLSSSGLTGRKPGSDPSLEFRMLSDQSSFPEDINVDRPCKLTEALLLDYIIGVASPDVVAMVEQSAACQQAAAQLADDMLPLLSVLYRANCPTSEQIVAYHEGMLNDTEQEALRHHIEIQKCPRCTEDLAMFKAFDTWPAITDQDQKSAAVMEASSENTLLERIKASFQLLTLQPQLTRSRDSLTREQQASESLIHQFRTGDTVHYVSPNVHMIITGRITRGKMLTWTLTGQIRTSDGLVLRNVQNVALHPLEGEYTTEPKEVTPQPDGTFSFRSLGPGAYGLTVFTDDEEIALPRFELSD